MTAINHFSLTAKKVYFMHIAGAARRKLARGVKSVWDAIKAVQAAMPPLAAFAGNVRLWQARHGQACGDR